MEKEQEEDGGGELELRPLGFQAFQGKQGPGILSQAVRRRHSWFPRPGQGQGLKRCQSRGVPGEIGSRGRFQAGSPWPEQKDESGPSSSCCALPGPGDPRGSSGSCQRR